MQAPILQPLMSVEEYLDFEREAETKHEYWDGEIVDMSGAQLKHNLVTSFAGDILRAQLKGRCRAVQSDMRVRIRKNKYVYPDVVVYCGEPELTDENPHALLNPTLLVEVTSASTAHIDYGRKLEAYRQIDTLLEYWILEYEDQRALQYVKQTDQADWSLYIHGAGATLRSVRLDVSIPVNELFAF